MRTRHTMLSLIFSVLALATCYAGDQGWNWVRLARGSPTAAQLRAANPGVGARGAAFTLDGFAGFYPRHQELKLGVALVLHNGEHWRPELQVANNSIGAGLGWKLPLKLLGAVLDISVGAGVGWDTARHEWQGQAYLARVVF
jgi:hypothetical protein